MVGRALHRTSQRRLSVGRAVAPAFLGATLKVSAKPRRIPTSPVISAPARHLRQQGIQNVPIIRSLTLIERGIESDPSSISNLWDAKGPYGARFLNI